MKLKKSKSVHFGSQIGEYAVWSECLGRLRRFVNFS